MNRFSRQFLLRALLLEGGLLGIAVLWTFFRKIPWYGLSEPTWQYVLTGALAGILLLAVNYVALEYGSRSIPFFRDIKHLVIHEVSPLFKNIPLNVVLVIAVVSGVAEEILFRAVLQHQIGLLLASLFFGLAHVWKKTALVYGIYAALIGLYFGALYMWTHNIWVPIISHAINNFVAILYYMKYLLIPDSSILLKKR